MKNAIYNLLTELISHVAPDTEENKPTVMYLYRNKNNEDIILQAISDLANSFNDGEINSIKITYNLQNEENPKEKVFLK